jgi:hypothetical protein
VTRLDAPSQVSTSVDGTIHVSSSSSSSKRNTSSTKTTTTTTNKTMEDAIQEWTSNGSVVTLQHHEENHTDDDDDECGITRLYWSQTRETVSIRIEVPAHTRARNVQVLLHGAVSVPQQQHHHDRTTTTSAAVAWTQPRPTLKITTTATATRQEDATSQRMVLLEGTLAYPVYVEEEDGLDWTLESAHEKKYIVVTLDKVTPAAGMTLWWTRPIEGIMEEVVHPQLDRRHGGGSSFPQAWKEAHEQFRENINRNGRKKTKKVSTQEEEEDEMI